MQIQKTDLENIVNLLKTGTWQMNAEQSLSLVDLIMRVESWIKLINDAQVEKSVEEKK